uniref:Uncharacterized protein n=1 Tax=Peronospora matthiolae TaxID=2874970 RepID=A0AAV1VBL6_9STRA
MAYCESMQLTIVDSVRLKVIARGFEIIVTLMDAYLEPRLAKNIFLHDKIDIKAFALVYDGEKCALSRRSEGVFTFDVAMESYVISVFRPENHGKHSAGDATIAVLEDGTTAKVAGDIK